MSEALAEASGRIPVTAGAGGGIRGVAGGVWERTSEWRPIIVGAFLALALSLSWLQWLRPFLEHDDWDMLLPNGPHFVVNHAHRVLHEGRWLNYWWWLLGSSQLSPRGAVALFSIFWLLVVAVMVRAFNLGWWAVPTLVALYSAPMIAEISYWPATLAAPVWALALTLAVVWLTRDRPVPHLVAIAVGTITICLGYPTLALFLLGFLVALHRDRSTKGLVALGATFASAYVAGLLAVFALNAARFGVFGLRINPSRRPTPLNSLPALGRHLQTAANDWGLWLAHDALPLVAVAITLVFALREAHLRRRFAILGLAFLGGAVLNSAATISSGVYTPYRAMGWTWLFLVLALVWGLDAIRPHARRIAGLGLVFVALWSTVYWAHGAIERYHHAGTLNLAETEIARLWHRQDRPIEVIYALPSRLIHPAEFQTMSLVANGLVKTHDIWSVQECIQCPRIEAFIDRHHLEGRAAFLWHDRIVVNFPSWLTRWVELSPYRLIEPLA